MHEFLLRVVLSIDFNWHKNRHCIFPSGILSGNSQFFLALLTGTESTINSKKQRYQPNLKKKDKTMKTKSILIILVLLLLGSALGACSSSTATSAPVETTVSETDVDTQSVPGAPPDGGPGGDAATVETGTGAYVLADGETLSGGTYTSTNADENAIRAEGDVTASLDGVTVEKTDGAASSNDASSFYGLNSAILALDNATLNITGGTVTATTEGANGVFAYDGATINIADTVINVSGGNAGGIEVAGGGTMVATNLTVNATVKAAIRSDRGGGNLTVDGGTYTTSGSSGAPAIYSTANIVVSNATLTANDSEAVVVEGLNSVTLVDRDVSGNMSGSGTYAESSGENIHRLTVKRWQMLPGA